jgi:membrane-associated phospholipid phosphatase
VRNDGSRCRTSALAGTGARLHHRDVASAQQPALPLILESGRALAPPHPRFHRTLLAVAAVCGAGLAVLTALVYANPILALDGSIQRAAQSLNVGPLTVVFDFYRQIGGPLGLPAEAVVFALILLLNRPAWRLLVAGAAASGLYFALVSVMFRARPSVPDVLRVTEHPSASSFPSGHTILFIFYAVVLTVCLGYRFLPRRWHPLAWGVAAAFVMVGGFSRIYSGAHWPSDVLAGAFIGVGWLSFALSIRWISDPVLRPGHARSHQALQALEPAGLAARPRSVFRVPAVAFGAWFLAFERYGLVVRGVLYALVGVLAMMALVGIGRTVDLQGSLTLLDVTPLRIPFGILASVGLLGYAMWGLIRAVADPLERGTGLHGVMARAGFLWSATAYTALAVFAIQFALGGRGGNGGGLPIYLVSVVTPPLIPWFVAVAGVVVIITGLGQFMDSWRAPFKTDFLRQVENPHMWRAWTWAGRMGLFARGVAFSGIGVLMILGGWNGEPGWDYGLTRIFAVLVGLPAGASLLVLVAVGFIALGLQSVTSPPVLRMKPGLLPPVIRRP